MNHLRIGAKHSVVAVTSGKAPADRERQREMRNRDIEGKREADMEA